MLHRAAYLLLLLTAVSVSAFAQSTEQNINVKIKPSQTVEERVADSIKERELREAAEEKLAAEKSERMASKSPEALLRRAKTVYVRSGTSYFEPVQLQNELLKRDEFDEWGMAIVDGYEKGRLADVTIEVDRPLFTFTFTYKIMDRANDIVLASGEITAFDGNIAAPILTNRIVKDIKKARGETTRKK
jgi:hypothetical protein